MYKEISINENITEIKVWMLLLDNTVTMITVRMLMLENPELQ